MVLQNAFGALALDATVAAVEARLPPALTPTNNLSTADDYQSGECLADQAGAGGVLTFTFTTAVQLLVIEAKGGSLTARADPFGGVPTASKGVVCDDGVPTYVPVTVTSVKIFAPAGMTVSVFGMRRA